ncbi:MAG TPA: MFS transporter [Cellvibrionaceae bacterium]
MHQPSLPAFERRTVMALASLYVFRMLGLFMVLPVLMLYGDDYTGSTPLLLGVALGAYGFSQALLQIPFGMLSDRIGRKPVIAAGLLIFAVGSVVAALSDSVYGLIAGRILQGAGAIAAAVMALVTDLTADENRTKAMATIGASIGVSFGLALVLGPMLAAAGGMALIFWVTAALALVGLYILFWQVPRVAHSRARRESLAVPALLLQTVKNSDLLRLNVGIFVLHFVLMACFVVLPGMLEQDIGLAASRHWWVYLPLLAGAFVAMLPFMILAEKRRQVKPVFLAAVVLLALGLLWLALMPAGLLWLLPGLFIFFMAFNLLEAMLPSLVSRQAPAGSKGTATGVYSSSQFLGAFAGGVAGGALLQSAGVMAVLLVATGLVILWWLLALAMRPPRYLASMLLALHGKQAAEVTASLQAIDGVEEVLVVESEQMVYLKVDNARVDRERIQQVLKTH